MTKLVLVSIFVVLIDAAVPSDLCPSECDYCRNNGSTLVFNCSSRGLLEVPQIPTQLNGNASVIVLDLRNNSIEMLPTTERNPGYGVVTKLLLDINDIEHWDVESLHENITFISITRNKLRKLDDQLVKSIISSNTLKSLHLGDNPWSCQCLLANQMRLIGSKLGTFRTPTCDSGTNLNDINKSCVSSVITVIVLGSVIFTLTVTFSALYFRHQHAIKIWLFTHQTCLNCVVTSKDADAQLPYDAFISYCHRDADFIVNEVLPTLERPPHSFKLCIHVRHTIPDEPAGGPQILDAIANSRRTILYVTKHYLESPWTPQEFRAAIEQSLQDNRSRLITILAGDVEQQYDETDRPLRMYLRAKTCLEKDDLYFWEKFLYAMPHRSAALMRQYRREQEGKLRKQTVLLREKNRRREMKNLADIAL